MLEEKLQFLRKLRRVVGAGISDCSGSYELQKENRGDTDWERASLSATSNGHLLNNGRLWKDERETCS